MSTARYTEGTLLIWEREAGKQSRSKHRQEFGWLRKKQPSVGEPSVSVRLNQVVVTDQVFTHNSSIIFSFLEKRDSMQVPPGLITQVHIAECISCEHMKSEEP